MCSPEQRTSECVLRKINAGPLFKHSSANGIQGAGIKTGKQRNGVTNLQVGPRDVIGFQLLYRLQ